MNKTDRIADALRAEANGIDLVDIDYPIVGLAVMAEAKDGTSYALGFVSIHLLYQDPDAAAQAISEIKFRAVN